METELKQYKLFTEDIRVPHMKALNNGKKMKNVRILSKFIKSKT